MTDEELNSMINQDPVDTSAGLIDKHVSELMEQFDTVIILCTRHVGSESTTQYYAHGQGNSFARYGHMQMYLAAEKERYCKLMNGE